MEMKSVVECCGVVFESCGGKSWWKVVVESCGRSGGFEEMSAGVRCTLEMAKPVC